MVAWPVMVKISWNCEMGTEEHETPAFVRECVLLQGWDVSDLSLCEWRTRTVCVLSCWDPDFIFVSFVFPSLSQGLTVVMKLRLTKRSPCDSTGLGLYTEGWQDVIEGGTWLQRLGFTEITKKKKVDVWFRPNLEVSSCIMCFFPESRTTERNFHIRCIYVAQFYKANIRLFKAFL